MPQLQAAFDAWLAHQRNLRQLRHASSAAVYGAMWQALTDWCGRQRPRVALRHLNDATLAAYLASRQGMAGDHQPLTPRYQARLLRLVQRVQAHALQQQAAVRTADDTAALRQSPAPALSLAGSGALAPASDEAPSHLAPAQAARLLRYLVARPPVKRRPDRWQDQRDRSAVALQLGAGLGPGELRALRLADVQGLASRQPMLPWRLSVAASGNAPAHGVPVDGWAARLLALWLQRRADEGLGGDWLYPSTRSGKPWGKVAQFESARRVLAAAGIAAAPGGSFQLRHSFALHQLKRGIAPDDLARRLGIQDPQVISRYQRLLAERLAQRAGPPDRQGTSSA